MSVFLKIVVNEWEKENRDKRELRVAKEMGYQTIVLATTKKSKCISKVQIDGFDVIQIPTRKFGAGKWKSILGKLEAVRLFVQEAKKLNATIISGHNYTGWLIGYLAYGKKGIYIYDSHEFELQQTHKKSFVVFHLVKQLEHFVVKHSAINMMVSDSIADAVQNIYKIPTRPLVIRNVSEKNIDKLGGIEETRAEFLSHLNISKEGTILMYHGGFARNRGIEQAIQAVAKLQDIGLVLLGYALDKNYEHSIIQFIEQLGCKDRIYIKSAVPFYELYRNIAAADLEIVLIQNTCTSFYFSLPNKLFESIQAGIPVIGSNFPEIGKIIDDYQIGLKIKPDDVDALIASIEAMRSNPKLYQRFKENMKKAQSELCWETEKIKLQKAIESLTEYK